MLKHPFLTKHQEAGLSKDILDDFKRVLGWSFTYISS